MVIGFIGTGRISEALVTGWCRAGAADLRVCLSPRGAEVSRRLAATFGGVRRCGSNQEVVDCCDTVVLAVRPPDAAAVLSSLTFRPEQTVVSLVPFLPLADLRRLVAPAAEAVRAIALPTAAVQCGPMALFPGNAVVEALFEKVGTPVVAPDERTLHLWWTVTGWIAPLYGELSSLTEWAVQRQAPVESTRRYVLHFIEALCQAARLSPQRSLEELARHAATPGGMNEQAVETLRRAGIDRLTGEILDALYGRFPSLETDGQATG